MPMTIKPGAMGSSKFVWAGGLAWAVSLSFILVGLVPFAWWHPYCDRMDDGPGYFAYGLPFPFRAFGGVSSLEYDFLPFAYLLDLVLVTALCVPTTIRVARKVR